MGVSRRVAVLASGRGSNFAAIAKAVGQGEIPGASLVGLVCNVPDAPVLEIASAHSVPTFVVDSKSFAQRGKLDRDAYELRLMEVLEPLAPDLICLAGYRLLLGERVLSRWGGRIINIHPSLLPAFKGLHAQRQALEYGVQWTGCTVHFVTKELDAGPIIVQDVIEIQKGDTEKTLTDRLLVLEHRAYVRALRRICSETL